MVPYNTPISLSFPSKTQATPTSIKIVSLGLPNATLQERTLSSQETDEILGTLLSTTMSEDTYYEQTEHTLTYLLEKHLISSETYQWLINKYHAEIKIENIEDIYKLNTDKRVNVVAFIFLL